MISNEQRYKTALENILKKCFDDSEWGRYINLVLKAPPATPAHPTGEAIRKAAHCLIRNLIQDRFDISISSAGEDASDILDKLKEYGYEIRLQGSATAGERSEPTKPNDAPSPANVGRPKGREWTIIGGKAGENSCVDDGPELEKYESVRVREVLNSEADPSPNIEDAMRFGDEVAYALADVAAAGLANAETILRDQLLELNKIPEGEGRDTQTTEPPIDPVAVCSILDSILCAHSKYMPNKTRHAICDDLFSRLRARLEGQG